MPMQSTEQQPAWSDHYIIALTGHRPKNVFVRNGSKQPYENPYDQTNSRWQALQQRLEQTVEQRLQEHPDRITNIAFIPNDEQTDRWPGPDPFLRNPNGALRYDDHHRRLFDQSKKASNTTSCSRVKSGMSITALNAIPTRPTATALRSCTSATWTCSLPERRS